MHPRLFHVGSFYLPTYGLLVATAYLIGIWLLRRKARREGLPEDRVFDLSIWMLVAAILGSKFLLVIVDFKTYLADPRAAWEVVRSAGVFYGGFAAASAVGIWYVRKHRLPLWRVADLAAPSIALGEAVGRWGCFAAGCCYGRRTDVAWAVTFTDPFALQAVGTPLNVPLHPTQIYLSLNALALFALTEWLYRRKKFDGEVFWVYVLGYALSRGFLEIFRGDWQRGFVIPGILSTSQFIGLLAAAVSVVMLVVLSRRARREAVADQR